MSRLKILVIECNRLVSLTINSIKANVPDWDYEVVAYKDGFIPTALRNSDELCLVVKSGIILDLKDGDLPDRELLEQYDICVSRDGVFTDNPSNKHIYKLVGSPINQKAMDLSIFCINPKRWTRVPNTDVGVLPRVKRLRMPRHMNHKSDPIVAKAISAKTAMDYGMLAEQASVFNYVDVFERGTVNGNEMFAYALEKALPFANELPDVQKLAIRTAKHAAKLRVGLAKCIPIQDITNEH
ncbi:MAG: hypothetical protein KJO69_06945 [Gammaproteobacteria bacterium]|nr:hypothetical protein [Gammaproteobacteria bacterium]